MREIFDPPVVASCQLHKLRNVRDHLPEKMRGPVTKQMRTKVRSLTRRAKHRTLADLLRRLNPVLRGWCTYFRHGVSSRTFSYVDHFAFWRIVGWLRKRHVGLNMHTLVRRYLPGWRIRDGGIEMFRANAFAIERYRYRGAKIPTPWSSAPQRITRTSGMNTWRAGCGESRTSGSEGGPGKPTGRKAGRAPRSDPYTELPTDEGKVYRWVVLDTYSRRVVGWAIDASPTAALVTNALGMAIDARLGKANGPRDDHSLRSGSPGRIQLVVATPRYLGVSDGQASGMDDGVDGSGTDAVAGRAVHRREVEREFWREIAKGLHRGTREGRGAVFSPRTKAVARPAPSESL